MSKTTSKLARIGTASLSTLLLVVAVAKGQGCQRNAEVPEVRTVQPNGGLPVVDSGSAVVADSADAGTDAAASADAGVAKRGLRQMGDSHPMMGATKSAGFFEPQGFGVTGAGWGQIGEQADAGAPAQQAPPNQAPK